MALRAVRTAVPASLAILVALVVLSTAVTLAPPSAPPPPAALLTVFTGSATVFHAGGAREPGRSGQRLGDGDLIQTGPDSKSGLFYPDGSVTRLDSDTAVTVRIARAARGGLVTALEQRSGLTWNRVEQLVGGGRFRISGPNSAIAGVRGTEFGYYVEHDPAGNPVIWIDTWSGSVDVSGALGPPVTAVTGQRVTVRAGSAPTAPVPIPPGDRRLPFTVFNQTLDAVTGTPAAFAAGALGPGGSASGTVAADGLSDLQFALGWPGSTFRMTVRDPSGAIAAQATSSAPPLSLVVRGARAGAWSFTVEDLESGPAEPWWVIAGRSPATGTG